MYAVFDTKYVKYGVLACYSDIYGKQFEKTEINKRIESFDIKLALSLIPRLISLGVAVNREDINARQLNDLIMTAHRCRVSLAGGNLYRYAACDTAYSPQTLYVLLKWFLAYGQETEPLRVIRLDDIMFILDMCLIVNDLLPKDDVAGKEADYLFVNLYHNTPELPLSEIGRGYYLYNVLARDNTLTKSRIELFEKESGYSISQYFAEIFGISSVTLCCKWDFASFCSGPFAFDNTAPDVKGLSDIHQKFIEKNTIQYTEIKDEALKTLNDVWDFEIFYLHPLIAVHQEIFAISETTTFYLLNEGLYWNIRWLPDPQAGKTFMVDFGKVFEAYVKYATDSVLSDSVTSVAVLPEFRYKYNRSDRASTDVYIRIGSTLYAIEAKAESLHSSILKGYNRKQLMTEVDSLLTSPIKQVDRRMQELLSDDVDWLGNKTAKEFFEGLTNIFAICVSREHLVAIGNLLLFADERIHEDNEYGQSLQTGLIKGYCNLDVTDYEALLALILEGTNISTLLNEWMIAARKDNLQVTPFSTFVSENGLKYRCPEQLETMFMGELDSLKALVCS